MRVLVLPVCVLVFALSGCDCAGANQPNAACTGPSPLAGCGIACGAAAPCLGGTHCTSGTCQADCSAATPCTGGATCTADGRCESSAMVDSGFVRPDVLPFDAPEPDNTCATVTLGATRTTPNVIVIIDRSGSMNDPFDATGSRWEVVRRALVGDPGAAASGLIFDLQSSVRFGIAMYSEDTGIAGCPDLYTVPCALTNYTPIQAEYLMRNPGGRTPTGDAINAIHSMIATLAPVRTEPTIFILATDGEPQTCAAPMDTTAGRALSVSATQAAFADGIKTYVVSVGTGVALTHLQEVANAGVGATTVDAPYWVATDTAGLQAALSTIIGGTLSCDVTLMGMIDVTQACSGTVTLGTMPLVCGTDWQAIDATHIRLLGAACDRLQRSSDVLMATFPCGVAAPS